VFGTSTAAGGVGTSLSCVGTRPGVDGPVATEEPSRKPSGQNVSPKNHRLWPEPGTETL
jgi:hypothetical protein